MATRPKSRRDEPFETWARTFACRPQETFAPTTIEEVQAIVREARASRRVVRVRGAGHSPNACAMTNDVLIDLRSMNRILAVDVEKKLVRAQGGVTIHQLNDAMAYHGLALQVLGSISDQTISGAFQTGTHGTGLHHGIMGTQLAEVQLVLGTGEVALCSRRTNPELFDAVRCGLGALGVVVGVVLEVTDAFDLEMRENAVPFDAFVKDAVTRARSAPFYRALWFPHTDRCWEVRQTPVAPAVHRTSPRRGVSGPWLDRLERLWNWVQFYAVGYYLLEFVLFLALWIPGLVPWINRVWGWLLFSRPRTVVDRSDRVFNIECLFRQHVDEWAVPVEHLPAALQDLRRVIEAEGLTAHFPVEIRFVQKDDVWLSPAYGRDVAYIGVIMYKPFGFVAPYERYFDLFEQIMGRYEGRPHWAKRYNSTPADLAAMYPHWQDFLDMRAITDPDQVFVNPWLARTLLDDDKLDDRRRAWDGADTRVVSAADAAALEGRAARVAAMTRSSSGGGGGAGSGGGGASK